MDLRLRRPSALLLALLLAGPCGCRRRARPPTSPAGAGCPAPESLAAALREPDRNVRTDCVDYAPGFFWLGVALAHDTGNGQHPRLSLLYGAHPLRAFDIDRAPADVLTKLIAENEDLRVSIRKTSPQSHLVRVGVYGQRGDPSHLQADELLVVLKLVAHAPPQLLWMGPGDRVRTTDDGCVAERTVDFDMPFGDHLEMTTAERAHPRPGSKAACPLGRSTQETVAYTPLPLPPSRAVNP